MSDQETTQRALYGRGFNRWDRCTIGTIPGFELRVPASTLVGCEVRVDYQLPAEEGVQPDPALLTWRSPPSWWRRLLRRQGALHELTVAWSRTEARHA